MSHSIEQMYLIKQKFQEEKTFDLIAYGCVQNIFKLVQSEVMSLSLK